MLVSVVFLALTEPDELLQLCAAATDVLISDNSQPSSAMERPILQPALLWNCVLVLNVHV